MKRGLLLVNLGTPDAPETPEVRRYLREFLSDPRVLDLPAVGRWLLLNLVILPFRPARSAAAYREVWTPQGSPLMVHSRALAAGLVGALGEGWQVELAMRYGTPSIEQGLQRLRDAQVSDVTVLPLYPLNAASSNATAVAKVFEVLQQWFDFPPVRVVPPFFDQPGYLDATVAGARPVLEAARPDHVLFSYHGIPERHLARGGHSNGGCGPESPCVHTLSERDGHCYRGQSYWLTRELGRRLELAPDTVSVGFQSRLGRTPWLRPYTDEVLVELAQRGVRRLVVLCPSFVSDCLETLEEIEIRGRESFRAAGGEELVLVPALNAAPQWVEAVVQMIEAPVPGLAFPQR